MSYDFIYRSHFRDYYIPTVANDAKAAIYAGLHDDCRTFESLLEALSKSDLVTGGTSDSYFGNPEQAAEHASQLFWDTGFSNTIFDSGMSVTDLADDGPEYMDVMARDAALGECYDVIRAAWYKRREKLAKDHAMTWRAIADEILSWPQDVQERKARVWVPEDFDGEEFPLISSVTPFSDDLSTGDPFMSINLMELNY